MKWTRFFSLRAALVKAVEEGTPIYKPSCYGNISEEQFRLLFRSETGVELPLIGQRWANLQEAARVLETVSYTRPKLTFPVFLAIGNMTSPIHEWWRIELNPMYLQEMCMGFSSILHIFCSYFWSSVSVH